MTAVDPFAGTPDTEQEATIIPITNQKESTVTESNTVSSQAKIVTTLKGGAGYDAPWVVIHSDTLDDAKEVLSDENLREVIDLAKKAGTYFSGGNSAPARGGKPAGASQAPAGAPTPPDGYVYKSGMGKNGRPWYAFMGANRNDNLDPIWLNADGSRRG